MTFGERLVELRKAAGMTQEGLAAASGLPLGSLRNYEQGQREPYWHVVFKLAEALGVGVDAFAVVLDDAPPEAPPKGKKKPRPAEDVAAAAAEDPPGEIRVRGVGIFRANEAINSLTRIPKNDALRKRGFQLVTDWIRRNP